MKRAIKKDVKVNVFSHNTFTFDSNTKVFLYAIALVVINKLLAIPFSDPDSLTKLLSSILSAFGC